MRGFTTSCLLGLSVIGLALTQAPAARAAAPDNQPVLIRMEVPANAEVWFDGAATTQTGPMREFISPSIAPDKNFSYKVRVRWMQDGKAVEQERSIRVHGGQQVNVDVTQQNVSVTRTAYYPPTAAASTSAYYSPGPTTWYSSSVYSGPITSGPSEPAWVPYDWNDYLMWQNNGTD